MILIVYNLITGVNETKHLVQNKSYEFKCGLNESVYNSKQKWNYHGCWCDCKELDDWGSCKNDCIGNPSTCDCKWKKACKIDEYLYIKITHAKIVFDKLVLACKYNWDLTYW